MNALCLEDVIKTPIGITLFAWKTEVRWNGMRGPIFALITDTFARCTGSTCLLQTRSEKEVKESKIDADYGI